SRGISNFRPDPQAQARALGSPGEACATLDAGVRLAAGRRGCARAGMDRADARQRIGVIAASYVASYRMAGAGLGAGDAARLDGEGRRSGSHAWLNTSST